MAIDNGIFLDKQITKTPANKPNKRALKLAVMRIPVGFTKTSIKTPATIEYATAFIQLISNPVEEIRSARTTPKNRHEKVAQKARNRPSQAFISTIAPHLLSPCLYQKQ